MQEVGPILSIIIPCYNHGQYIREALESIELAKNKYSVEIIIVNDGSNDAYTLQVFNELESEGYCILHQKNEGLGNARNNGIKIAKGKYILPLDSDNKVLYPYLNDAIDILETNGKIDIVYGNAIYFGEQNRRWIQRNSSLQRIMLGNCIDACAVYRKTGWSAVEGYSEDMPVMGYEDWEFWLKLYFQGSLFYYLDKDCFQYRVLSNSMIRTAISKELYVKQYLINKYKEKFDWDSIEKYAFKLASKNPLSLVDYITFYDLIKLIIKKTGTIITRVSKQIMNPID